METTKRPKRRRPKGAGSLKKRGAVWHYRICIDGHMEEKSTGCANWNDAIVILNNRLKEVKERGATQVLVRPEKIVVRDLLALVADDYAVNRKASEGALGGHVRAWEQTDLIDRAAADLGYDDFLRVTKWWQEKTTRRGAPTSNATINRRLSALQRGYALARRAGKLTTFPVFPHLKEDNVREGFVSPGDFTRFLGALPDDGLRDFVEWLGLTGMRRGEASKLQWSYIFRTPDGGHELRIPSRDRKNRKPNVVPLVGRLSDIIERRRAARRLDCPLIFWRFSDGQPRRIYEFRKTWMQAADGTGLTGLLPHDLCRSTARNGTMAGEDRDVIKKLMGRKTDSIFTRYNVADTTRVAGAIETMSRLFDSSSESKVAVLPAQ